ncbi:MAG: nucleotidyltransferase [Spirochaetales bacterium]|nr:nucleotidyltransferase [Spirochaetales bacterium]
MDEDVRWVQRLQNFQKAFHRLKTALAIASPDEVQRAGMIQFFEMSFELGWNVLKDYLEAQGFSDVSSPRTALKKAFQEGLISNGRGWLKGLDDRNLTSHTYDELTASKVETLIREEYYQLFEELSHTMDLKK